MAVRFDRISASAVSQILGRAGLKRAAKKGYTTGYDVVGVITAAYVYVQETDEDKRQEVTSQILGIFNTRPGYAATLETPSHMVGIDDSKVIHVRRPVQVVEVVEIPEQTAQEALAGAANALNGKGFYLNIVDQTVNVVWAVPFSGRARHTQVTFDERSQAFETPHTQEVFRTLEGLLGHVEEFLVESGER